MALSARFAIIFIATSTASVLSVTVAAKIEDNLVRSLPGFSGSFPSPHYAGYITVDEKHNRKLYYYFVTSTSDPKKDPVVLWMNGGPGCSSFDGFIYEHGPFLFEVNKTGGLPSLHVNPYSWSKVSNMIYLESPAGVGFSYSNNTSDYQTDDLSTAKDVHQFLLKWFDEYEEFQSNPFFVSGESYAGVYVPTVVQEIVNGIRNGIQPKLNLKGYLIGNGVTDDKYDGNALVPFVHGMGLISDKLFKEAMSVCNASFWNVSRVECSNKLEEINSDIEKLNIYDILEPCYHDSTLQTSIVDQNRLPESFKMLGATNRSLPIRRRMFGRAWPLKSTTRNGIALSWFRIGRFGVDAPCLDFQIANRWLNDPSVREAIHAAPVNIVGTWVVCSNKLSYMHNAGSMLPYHEKLLSLGYRALIYSGDHDMCVPFTGSQAWTSEMGYDIVKDWHPWCTNGQVAGFSISYCKNLTFATIKGAGHSVPEYKPEESLYFFTKWLANGNI